MVRLMLFLTLYGTYIAVDWFTGATAAGASNAQDCGQVIT